MTSLDPITDHWVSLGGQLNSGSRALVEQHDADSVVSERGRTSRDRVLRQMSANDVNRAIDQPEAAMPRKDWAEAKPHREWLKPAISRQQA